MDTDIKISKEDSAFLTYLRSISIFIIVFGHIGGFWAFKPYSEFLHVFVPVFFFISGAVSLPSYTRSKSIFHYYLKRFTGLLVPYYLLCLLCLLVSILQNGEIPLFDWHNLSLWLQLSPPGGASPFPLGHIWFLHTLFFIILISPLYFHFVNNKKILAILLFLAITPSAIQLIYDIDNSFYLFGNNLFKPTVHSSFFIFGFMLFTLPRLNQTKLLMVLCLGTALLSVFVVYLFSLNIDYEYHTFAPDLYYVAGSFSAIFAILIAKKLLLKIIESLSLLKVPLKFLHHHTFSIYLLHVPVVFLFNRFFMPEDLNAKDIKYALFKLLFVLAVTSIVSIPFTYVSKKVTSVIIDSGVLLFSSLRTSNQH